MNDNFLEEWQDRPRELNHDERVTELTKFIFTPITDFDLYEAPDRNHQILVAVEVDRNDDDPAKPHYFNLAHFVAVTEDIQNLLDKYPSPEEVGTYNGRIDANAIRIREIQDELDIFQSSVDKEIKRIDEEFYITNTLQKYASTPPFGYIYTQYPEQKAPDELWLLSQWKQLSTDDKMTLWQYQESADRMILFLALFNNRLSALDNGISEMLKPIPVPFEKSTDGELLPMSQEDRYIAFNERLSQLEGQFSYFADLHDKEPLEKGIVTKEFDFEAQEEESEYDLQERLFSEFKERLYELEKKMIFLISNYPSGDENPEEE